MGLASLNSTDADAYVPGGHSASGRATRRMALLLAVRGVGVGSGTLHSCVNSGAFDQQSILELKASLVGVVSSSPSALCLGRQHETRQRDSARVLRAEHTTI